MKLGVCRLIFLIVLLSGCSVGIREDASNARSESFSVPITYQEAYRRADAFARHCHTSSSFWKGSFAINGNLYTDNRTGVVRIQNKGGVGADLMRIEITATSDTESKVTLTEWNPGIGIWDQRQFDAAKQSVETGQPTCR